MNIYDAIMKAADTIENMPRLYNFHATRVQDCNTPQCMMGWIGFHLGVPQGERIYGVVMPMLGLSEHGVIGDQMGATEADIGYTHSPAKAARLLRHFAKRFKPVTIGIPDEVRAIFQDARRETVHGL